MKNLIRGFTLFVLSFILFTQGNSLIHSSQTTVTKSNSSMTCDSSQCPFAQEDSSGDCPFMKSYNLQNGAKSNELSQNDNTCPYLSNQDSSQGCPYQENSNNIPDKTDTSNII